MKEEVLGTFFGQEIILKVDEDNTTTPKDWNWQERWQNWLDSERKQAVEEYKTELFLKEIEKAKRKSFWNWCK